VRVRGDEGAGLRSLVHRRVDLLLGELGLRRRRAGGKHRAGRNHLDEVGAAREQFLHALAHFGRAAGDAAAHLVRNHDALGFGLADHLTAATGRGDVGSGDVHARALDLAGVDRVAERDVHERTVGADVAHGREPGVERRARVRDAHERVACRGARERRGDVRGADVADEVRVQVDESRQHRVCGPVNEAAAAARVRGPRRDRDDAAVLDADRTVRQVLAALDVQHLSRANDDGLGESRGRERGHGQDGEERRADELHALVSLRRNLIVAGSMAAPDWKPVTFPARLHHLAIGFRAVRNILTLFAAFATFAVLASPRARDLGVPFEGNPGSLNAITDVAGVTVGQVTLIEDLADGHKVRTGVTAILPRGRDTITTPAFAGSFVLNGAGEMTGRAWIDESGLLDGPVMLTNTHSVGTVHEATIAWRVKHGNPDASG